MKKEGFVKEILGEWGITGNFETVTLDDGFSSNNIMVKIGERKLVLRKVYLPKEVIHNGAGVYNYLYEVGLNVPAILQTNKGEYSVGSDEGQYVLQTFIEGEERITGELFIKNLGGFAQLFGLLHRTLYESEKKRWKSAGKYFMDHTLLINRIKEVDSTWLAIPDIQYVRDQHSQWVDELKEIPLKKLTKGVIHGNIGPNANILHINGKISGFTNFFEARYGYYLFDLATFMMYGQLFHKDNAELTKHFLLSYLDTGPIRRKEIKYLRFFLRMRFLLQVMFFAKRTELGHLQGVESKKENLQGLEDGIKFLKILDDVPKGHFAKLIEGSYSIV